MLRRTVVLGAGFSRAVSDQMPLTDGLGTMVSARLRDQGHDVPRDFEGGTFETWVSSLAEPQPYLSEAENLESRALFLRVASEIREVLVEVEQEVLSHPPAWSLQCFVGALHTARADVITFNYDTLLERAIGQQGRIDWDTSTQVSGVHVIQNRPAPPPTPGMWGIGSAETFRLLKLHGSLDVFWVPDDRTGATINRLGDGWRWTTGALDPRARELRLPGRSPFIVPPAATKSAFYGNPFSNQLWREAANALTSAEQVDVVGYSLPATDLVVSSMIKHALAESPSQVTVVNPCPDPVAGRLHDQGIEVSRIQCVSGDGAFDEYVDDFQRSFRPLLESSDAFKFALAQDSQLIVASGRNSGAPVLDMHVEAESGQSGFGSAIGCERERTKAPTREPSSEHPI